jgi:ATP-dependent protease ClpP protease subunit
MTWGEGEDDSEEYSEPTTVTANEGESGVVGNRLFFYKQVDQKSMMELVQKIRQLETKCLQQAAAFEIDTPPIHLHINSFGGEVYAALAAVDHIAHCRAPVYTYIDGAAASAATLISLAGSKRYIYPNAFMLIHQISSEFWGKYEEVKDEMINTERLMQQMTKIYKKWAKIPEVDLDAILKRDIWLDAEQCVSWGLADEIKTR